MKRFKGSSQNEVPKRKVWSFWEEEQTSTAGVGAGKGGIPSHPQATRGQPRARGALAPSLASCWGGAFPAALGALGIPGGAPLPPALRALLHTPRPPCAPLPARPLAASFAMAPAALCFSGLPEGRGSSGNATLGHGGSWDSNLPSRGC